MGNALVLGDWTDEAWRVQAKETVSGITAGGTKYVRGTEVQALIDEGKLVSMQKITNMPAARRNRHRKKVWYVDGVGYPSVAAAQVKAEELGLPVEERMTGK